MGTQDDGYGTLLQVPSPVLSGGSGGYDWVGVSVRQPP